MDFLLLLDTSGSMYGENGEKILGLNQAFTNFMDGLRGILPEPRLAVITYGGSSTMHDFHHISQIAPKTYEARGRSPLSEATALAADIVTKNVITILISDGAADDSDYTKISLKGPVYAIAVGADADHEQLARFTGSPKRVLPPHAASDLPGYALQKLG